MIYLSDIVRRRGALAWDVRHDVDGYAIRLYVKLGRTVDIKLSRRAKLIVDI